VERVGGVVKHEDDYEETDENYKGVTENSPGHQSHQHHSSA
jgi:hypothetical protein